jgi:casein kinase II subunit beta
MPIGLTDSLSTARVKVYCPKCEDIYIPKKKVAELDGAYFGTSFPMALLQTYPDLVPVSGPFPLVPKVFGFKIYGLRGSKYEKPSQGATSIG